MKNIFTLFFFSSLLVAGFSLQAQNPFSFVNANFKFTSTTFKSGNALSVVDMDGDGLDDIARLNGGDDLYYTLQQTGQLFNDIHAVVAGTGDAWAMVVGDVNNDGKRDVAVGYGSSAKLVVANTTLTNFNLLTLPNSGFFLQNMNFADINNDGWIDIFGCNDNGASRMWGNDGAGGYPSTSTYFSTDNTGSTDNSGNYGSIWSDVNNDGHVDLYIAHCRQNNTPQDGNRLDQLFINDGNNNYVLDAAPAPGARGLRNNQQTWTASFDDIDNDGDFDCLLTQTDAPSQLFLNNGNGYFTEITSGSGFVLDVTAYQSKMEDLDNDGFVDFITAGDDARIFRNNHDNTFTEIPGLFDNNDMLSFATGDLNHDGKIDLYSSYGSPYNNPSNSVDDVLWLNNTNNGNHFITFNLQGTQSNRDALGAKVEIYGAWGKQIREVRAGESYGTTNSLMCHFGLGSATAVDSVIVHWPRGQTTRLYNREADQFITVVEGQCSSPDNIIAFNGPSVLCAGQSVTMSAAPGYSYLWNTGATTQTLSTSVTGDFTVKVTDVASGCSSISKMVTVKLQPDETPTLTVSGATRFCQGDSVILQSTPAAGYLWNTGVPTQSIAVRHSGVYFVTIQGTCAFFSSDSVTITVDTSEVLNTVSAGTCEDNPMPLTLQTSTTGDAYWYDDITGGNLLGAGTSYTTPVLNNTTTYYVESRDTVNGLAGNVGPVDNAFGTGGNFPSGNRYQIFDVFKDCILKTVKVYAATAGNRTVELRSSTGALINSAVVYMPTGESVVTLDFPLTPGTDYRLGWNGSSPNLYRNNTGASYPYTIPNLISVTNSSAGSAYWYAYYNWRVEELPVTCISHRAAVTASVNPLPSADITPNGATDFCIGDSVILSAGPGASYLWSDNSISPSITVTQTGSYSVTVTNAYNCSNSSSQAVTVYSLPDATVTSNKPTSICPGDSVTLSAPAGLIYSWSNNTGGESITVSDTGTFIVTVTDNNSCSAQSTPIVVTVSNNAVAGITTSGPTTFCEGDSVQLTASAGTSYLWSNNFTTPDITVRTSGTFSVTVTTPGSCVAISNPVDVVVNQNPSTPVITASGATTFCEGDSVSLSAGSASAYLWSNGSTLPTIIVNQIGSYTVEITDTNGCSAISSIVSVIVNQKPMVSISGLGPLYLDTDTPVLITGLPSGGSFSGAGVSGSAFDPSIAGVGGPYAISYNYTDSNGCSASASFEVTVVLGLSSHQSEGISAVSIIPNPNGGEFLLTMQAEGVKEVDVEVSNYIGEKVFREKNVRVSNTLIRQIDLKNVAKGFYNLTVTSDKKLKTYKLMIQ